MAIIVLPGCSVPEKVLFRTNSTLDVFFKEFKELTYSISLKSILFIVTVYLILNIFHLIILTRPSMRSLIVSNEMILIAVIGILSGFMGVVKNVVEIIEEGRSCNNLYGYHLLIFEFINFVFFQTFNQIILWDIVYITFLRATIILDVRHGMNTRKLKLYMRRFVFTMFAIFLLNHLIRLSFHRIEENFDKEHIEMDVDGKKCIPTKVYEINSIAGNCLRRIFLTIAGISSLAIPVLMMLGLSVFLFVEMRIIPEASTSSVQTSTRQNVTARALLLFLCFYVLAEFPYVILFSVGLYNPADFEQLDEYTFTQIDIFIYVNMCAGILVYCLMSSQYRETITATFWKKKSKKNAVGDQNSRTTF